MRNVWMTKCMGVKKEMRRTCITLSGLTNFEIKFFLFFFFFFSFSLFGCLQITYKISREGFSIVLFIRRSSASKVRLNDFR